jgi:hypothetical protein
MRFCQTHWDRLREAIKNKGLNQFVSADGETLTEKIKKEVKEEVTIPDPLFAAHNAIVEAAIKQGGLYLLGKDEEGKDYCPLCEVNKYAKEEGADEDWIQGSTDDVLAYFTSKGLIGN